MDWQDVGKLVAPMAPFLGGLIGGFIPFPGAAAAGTAIGGIVAKAFGVPATPDAVAGAIQANPNEVVLAKLAAAKDEAIAQWPALAQIEQAWARVAETGVEQVGATMRLEIGHEHWFFTGWRPAAGWIFDFYALIFGAILMVAGIAAAFFGQTNALNALNGVWPLYLGYFGTLAAMVGVYVIGRSTEKAKLAEVGTSPAAPAALAGKPIAVPKPAPRPIIPDRQASGG